MKKIIIALALLASLTVAGPTADAGSSCYSPQRARSGNYVTWSVYGSGPGWHRVVVTQGGHKMYGEWKYGKGTSYRTIYAPSWAGVATCQVW